MRPMPPDSMSAPALAAAKPFSAFSYPAWIPACLASLEKPALWTGMPSEWPTSVPPMPTSVFSRQPRLIVEVRMSRMPGPQQAMIPVPGWTC